MHLDFYLTEWKNYQICTQGLHIRQLWSVCVDILSGQKTLHITVGLCIKIIHQVQIFQNWLLTTDREIHLFPESEKRRAYENSRFRYRAIIKRPRMIKNLQKDKKIFIQLWNFHLHRRLLGTAYVNQDRSTRAWIPFGIFQWKAL